MLLWHHPLPLKNSWPNVLFTDCIGSMLFARYGNGTYASVGVFDL